MKGNISESSDDYTCSCPILANTKHLYNIYTMLDRRRCINVLDIGPTLYQINVIHMFCVCWDIA